MMLGDTAYRHALRVSLSNMKCLSVSLQVSQPPSQDFTMRNPETAEGELQEQT